MSTVLAPLYHNTLFCRRRSSLSSPLLSSQNFPWNMCRKKEENPQRCCCKGKQYFLTMHVFSDLTEVYSICALSSFLQIVRFQPVATVTVARSRIAALAQMSTPIQYTLLSVHANLPQSASWSVQPFCKVHGHDKHTRTHTCTSQDVRGNSRSCAKHAARAQLFCREINRYFLPSAWWCFANVPKYYTLRGFSISLSIKSNQIYLRQINGMKHKNRAIMSTGHKGSMKLH